MDGFRGHTAAKRHLKKRPLDWHHADFGTRLACRRPAGLLVGGPLHLNANYLTRAAIAAAAAVSFTDPSSSTTPPHC